MCSKPASGTVQTRTATFTLPRMCRSTSLLVHVALAQDLVLATKNISFSRTTHPATRSSGIGIGALPQVNRNASDPVLVNGSCTVIYPRTYCQNRFPNGHSGAFSPGLQANVSSVAACWAAASEHAECGDEIVLNAPASARDRLQCFCIRKGETCLDPTRSTNNNSVYRCRHDGPRKSSQQANVLLLTNGSGLEPPLTVDSVSQFIPLYGDSKSGSVGFHWAISQTSALVTSYAADGTVRWNISVPHNATTNVSIGGGFDFDSDGIPDLSLIYHSIASPASSCGRYPMGQSDFALMRGATGDVVSLSGLLPKEEQADLCWDFREPSNPVQTKQCNETQHCVYPTQQWTSAESPIWGSDTPVLVFSPTYSQVRALLFDGQLHWFYESIFVSLPILLAPDPRLL